MNQSFYERTGRPNEFTRWLPEAAVDYINIFGAANTLNDFIDNPDVGNAAELLEAADYISSTYGDGVLLDDIASVIGVDAGDLVSVIGGIVDVNNLVEVFQDGDVDTAGELVTTAKAIASLSNNAWIQANAAWLGPVGWALLAYEVLTNYDALENSVKGLLRGDQDYKRVQGTGTWDADTGQFQLNATPHDGGDGIQRWAARMNSGVNTAVNGLIEHYNYEWDQETWDRVGGEIKLQTSGHYNRGEDAHNGSSYVARLIQAGVLRPSVFTPQGDHLSDALTALDDYVSNGDRDENYGDNNSYFTTLSEAAQTEIGQRRAVDVNGDGQFQREEIADVLFADDEVPEWLADSFGLGATDATTFRRVEGDTTHFDGGEPISEGDLVRAADGTIYRARKDGASKYAVGADAEAFGSDSVSDTRSKDWEPAGSDSVTSYQEYAQYDLDRDFTLNQEEIYNALRDPDINSLDDLPSYISDLVVADATAPLASDLIDDSTYLRTPVGTVVQADDGNFYRNTEPSSLLWARHLSGVPDSDYYRDKWEQVDPTELSPTFNVLNDYLENKEYDLNGDFNIDPIERAWSVVGTDHPDHPGSTATYNTRENFYSPYDRSH